MTDLSKEQEELLFNFGCAQKVQQASIALVKGEMSADDFLDAVEEYVPIDNYLDEICENVEIFLYQ
ncbi:hypothetical protein [Brunnivagina elsteri]|uniref:hypothetical protein n=1 Tax=Brunnivagina elsteri TaxID=1247191 RepID=UPI0011777A65|nr:hypothetical protein [Calothrix elsteri]